MGEYTHLFPFNLSKRLYISLRFMYNKGVFGGNPLSTAIVVDLLFYFVISK